MKALAEAERLSSEGGRWGKSGLDPERGGEGRGEERVALAAFPPR
jgi:hypothetical protein